MTIVQVSNISQSVSETRTKRNSDIHAVGLSLTHTIAFVNPSFIIK